ncbi:MAG: sulfite exporter TauE/SafE family protein, partial [Myxococcaceae bacterium]
AALPGSPAGGRTRALIAYQGARALSYTAVGALLGTVGGGVASVLAVSTRPWLPWIMAAALVASALELGKRLRPIPGIRHLVTAITRLSAKFSSTGRAAAIGAATPLLPCGLLYGVFAGALVAGSAATGALILGAFALGGVPALLLAQAGTQLVSRRGGRVAFVLRRIVPIAGALALIIRATITKNNCH